MKIVTIPEKMEKFYGIGTMLHPDKEMVEKVIKEIPFGKVTTIDLLGDRLARDHGTDVTCPMRTTNFVKTLTEIHSELDDAIPFWRVIRKNHQLINSPYTGLCVANLEMEGFHVSQNKKGDFKVEEVDGRIFTFS